MGQRREGHDGVGLLPPSRLEDRLTRGTITELVARGRACGKCIHHTGPPDKQRVWPPFHAQVALSNAWMENPNRPQGWPSSRAPAKTHRFQQPAQPYRWRGTGSES
jgi:hypothetical protein